MAGYRLNLLGGFELRDQAGQRLRFPTRKAEGLLAYLALAPESAKTRDALRGLLWGEAPESSARASLRQTLSLIGKVLPGTLASSGRSVVVVPDALQVDALEFERCRAGENPQTLARAAALYGGPLLEGLAIAEPAFDEWLLGARARLAEQAIDVLARLIAIHQQLDEPDSAVQFALRLLAIDPLDEVAHRALMRLYASQGRSAAALRQYQICVSGLARELGTEPDAQTRALYNEILVQPARSNAAAQTAAEPAAQEAPYVGRIAELQAVSGLLRDLNASRGRLLAILGEAGIGKTRLTQELATMATRAGVQLLIGRSYESERLFPFALWVEMFRTSRIVEDRELFRKLDPSWRVALGRLMPELSGDLKNAAEDVDAAPRPGHMFEAIVRLVAAIASRGPLLLILEDLHWADDLSLRLIAAAGRRVEGQPVSLVMTARGEELQEAPVLRATLQELDRDGALTRLRLDPLSQADTTLLVRALARKGADEQTMNRLAKRVWQASEGNPFVAIESMRALGDEATARSDGLPDLPARVRDLIQGQLERLSAGARALVAIAGVAGREFDFALLQRASGMSEREASEALEELVRRQLLHVVDTRFDFVHDRIRRVVDEMLLPPARRLHHEAIAVALEELFSADLVQVYDRLAYHYARTDRVDKAITYLERFAERAARAGAHDQAIAALDDALGRLAPSAEALLERRRFELVFRKSRSLLLLGRLKEVIEILGPFRAFVDAAADPRIKGAFYLRLGAACNYLGDRRSSTRHATRALDEATSCDDRGTMAKAHVLLANDRFWGQPELGVRHGESAVALLRELDLPWWLGQAYWILGLNLSYRGRFVEALKVEALARELGDVVRDRRLACTAAWATGFISTLAGDLETAISACRKGVEAAPDPLSRMTASGMLALAHVERREPEAAISILDEAIPLAERFRFSPLHGLYLGFRGEAALQQGDGAAALSFAIRGEEITRKAEYVYGLGWTQRILARIDAAAGNVSGARARFEEACATFGGMGAPFETARTRLELARLLHAAADHAGAREHAEIARQAFESLELDQFANGARELQQRLDDPRAPAHR